MARLYVLNALGQNRIVNYRTDYTVDDQGRRTSERLMPYKSIHLPARMQIPFGGDWSPMQMQEIIQQLEQSCGAVHSSSVKTAKKMGKVEMVWQEDRPISKAICDDVRDHNVGYLTADGAERRRRMALVADVTLLDAALQDGMRAPGKFEVEFEQTPETETEEAPGRLEAGIRVARRPAPEPVPKKPRRRAA